MAEETGGKNVAIGVLIASTIVQIFTLMFLWKPEKFKETWDKLKLALKAGKDKVKGAVSKDPKAP
ncbi:MAG: hypothetical protein NTX82_03875 [Candidatus Parcubacteria bacterium]|nr:hypothetical protein [Candidatus Parcubacteria bacterium]